MLIEAKKSIIDCIKTQLGPYLTHFDARQWHVSVFISDLHHKRLDTAWFTLDRQLGHYYAVVGCVCHWKYKSPVKRPRFSPRVAFSIPTNFTLRVEF